MASLKKIVKRVFISSTVYDLGAERALVRTLLEEYRGSSGITFKCLASDRPDFPISPVDRATKHSFDVCIENVAKADYFVLLMRKRYGAPVITNNRSKISITHREFREAHRLKIPRFVLIDNRTWDAKHDHEAGKSQSFVPGTQIQIFDFIDEIRKKTKGNWLDFYKSRADITNTISTFLDKYDDSNFVGDLTFPLGARVGTNERFLKVWEIENNGLTAWRTRFLQEDNPTSAGLIPERPRISIPLTLPGRRVRLSVAFTAPSMPATCESYWKMVDKAGNYCFPHKSGLTCCVKVI